METYYSATVTPDGMLPIPNNILAEMRLKPGQEVSYIKNVQGDYVLSTKPYTFHDFAGCLEKEGGIVLTDDELNDAISNTFS